jgi:hypothetical protein
MLGFEASGWQTLVAWPVDYRTAQFSNQTEWALGHSRIKTECGARDLPEHVNSHRAYLFCVNRDARFASHDVEQDPDAAVGVGFFDLGQEIGEWAMGHGNLIAWA